MNFFTILNKEYIKVSSEFVKYMEPNQGISELIPIVEDVCDLLYR